MEKEIIYRKIGKNEFKNCLKLISKLRKNSNLNKKFIEWEYFLNPFGNAIIFVAEYRKEFIGITFCNPLKFQNNKKICNGYRLQDILTNINFLRKEIKSGRKIPRKGGIGVLPNLLKVTNNYLDENSEINIGFPNEKSLPFFEKNKWFGLSKIPWVLHNIPLLSKTLNDKEKFKLEYSLIDKFTNVHENIWKKNIGDKVDIMWTKEYSNWRYALNPRFNYKIFEIKNNGKIIGYMVLKKFEKKNEMAVGHICQLVCHDNYIIDNINFASNYFFDLSIKILTMWKINDRHLPIKDSGFEKIFLEKKKFMHKGKIIFNKSSLNLSMSYSDTF